MGEWRVRVTSLWRAVVAALGASWVFVPLVLFAGVLAKGSGPWASTWIWFAVLVVVGPGLALAIRAWSLRVPTGRRPRGLDRVLRHFRGSDSPT